MLEVKGTLARLLAQEDLIVEHRQVETAQFDVERRVLTLPLWQKAGTEILDMLIAHEVGHALYTPNNWDHIGSVPQSYVNVIEDVRIEKLMKRRYAGLPKTFYNGYQKFAEQDFFQLRGRETEELCLADRINLHYKVGSFEDIYFTEEEQVFVDAANNVETFEDVIELAKLIAKYDREQKESDSSQTPTDAQTEMPSGSEQSTQLSLDEELDNTEGEQENSEPKPQSQDQDQSELSEQGEPQGGSRHEEGLEALTDSISKESIQDLVDSSAPEINYIQIPELDLKEYVVSHKEYLDCLEGYWNEYEDVFRFEEIDQKFTEFKNNSNREVNYLVKEFECRKAASSHARSAVSRTGVLDTTKLHSYRYNEDIFKKITITKDGKSHGLIFNLDWSGSMQTVIYDTVKQLLNLVSFCRKVKIPFEVYIFTNEWTRTRLQECWYKSPKKDGDLVLGGYNLVNVLSSSLKTKDLDKAMRYIFRMSYVFCHHTNYSVPNRLNLSGTPLAESILTMKQIIPIFQRQNKVEKVHLINLTDGEGCPLSRWHYSSVRDFMGHRDLHNCQLRDRKLGRIYPPVSNLSLYNGDVSLWVQNIRDTFPQASVVNIRLISGNEFNRRVKWFGYEQMRIALTEFKKYKSYIDPESSYTRELYIHSNTFDDSKNEFEVKEDAKKGDITRAFKKSLKNKKSNKRILTEFVKLVA